MENNAYPHSEDSTAVTSELEELLGQWTGRPAGAGLRFANFIIDYVALFALVYIGTIVLVLFGVINPSRNVSTGANRLLSNYLWFALLYVVYYTLMEGLTGRTIGKLCTGTRVVKETRDGISIKEALLRSLCRLVPFEIFSGFGFPWHDTWTKTTVVRNNGN